MSGQGRGEIRRLLERHGRHPRKHLGQHFLADPNVVARIVALADVGPGDQVVEIGAGTGALTTALAASGATVVAYEIDEGLRPLLAEVIDEGVVDLRFADAMDVDFESALGPGDWTMVANLPYGVGTPLVLEALRTAPRITRFVVMVQREVADRLAAEPGSKAYGFATVVAALHGSVRFGFAVGPKVFFPPPDVESAVVVIERRSPPPLVEEALRLAAAGFGQRRKMLRRSLAGALDDPVAVLTAAGIDPQRRPEQLAPEEFVRIAEVAP